jgi:hypothetical protein
MVGKTPKNIVLNLNVAAAFRPRYLAYSATGSHRENTVHPGSLL